MNSGNSSPPTTTSSTRPAGAGQNNGEIARADADNGTVLVTGTCAPDRSAAAYTLLRLATSPRARPGRVALPGLDPDRTYAVRVRTAASDPALVEIRDPASWLRRVGDGVSAA